MFKQLKYKGFFLQKEQNGQCTSTGMLYSLLIGQLPPADRNPTGIRRRLCVDMSAEDKDDSVEQGEGVHEPILYCS